MTKIVAFSGKKSSGKNTSANFIVGLELVANGVVSYFNIRADGRLYVPFTSGQESVLDIANTNNPEYKAWLEQVVWPHVKLYSFADLLKQHVCIDILGLTYEQCYGIDEQKNSLTDFKWEDMPNVTSSSNIKDHLDDSDKVVRGQAGGFLSVIKDKLIFKENGLMTAREVMQHVGTELFRKIKSNVWAEALVKKIEKDNTKLALVTDCRFPDEVKSIQKCDGKVIRLTRHPYSDKHESEIALDKENFNWDRFDEIIDNEHMNIGEQNDALYKTVSRWKYLSGEIIEKTNDNTVL